MRERLDIIEITVVWFISLVFFAVAGMFSPKKAVEALHVALAKNLMDMTEGGNDAQKRSTKTKATDDD